MKGKNHPGGERPGRRENARRPIRPQFYHNRPLPPHAKNCTRLLAKPGFCWGRSSDGKYNTVMVGMGSEVWEWAAQWRDIRPVAILPNDRKSDEFCWHFCSASNPVLVETIGTVDHERVHALAAEIVRQTGNTVLHLGGQRYLPEVTA